MARVEGRTIRLHRTPDLWLGGVAAAIGLGAWAYDRHWQVGALAGLASLPVPSVLYPLMGWAFDWPPARPIDWVWRVVDLLDIIVSLLSIFS